MSNQKMVILGPKFEIIKTSKKIDDGVHTNVQGDPSAHGTRYLTHPTGALNIGIWECEAGKWSSRHLISEMFTVLEGGVVITDEDGVANDLTVGDSIYIPRGTIVHWHIADRLKKSYTMMPQLDVS